MPMIRMIQFVAAVALVHLAACGGRGDGNGAVSMPDTRETPLRTAITTEPAGFGSTSVEDEERRITTSFRSTKLDHYPFDATFTPQKLDEFEHLTATGEAKECCWEMVEKESEVVQRDEVLAMLRENIFDVVAPNGRRHEGHVYVHASPPVIRFVEGTPIAARRATIRAVDNINAWLPWERHVTVGDDLDAITSEFVTQPDQDFDIDEYLAILRNLGPNIVRAYLGHDYGDAPVAGNSGYDSIRIAQDSSQDVNVIQHELLHAMGLGGGRTCAEMFSGDCFREDRYAYEHVPVAQFPESEMAYASPHDPRHGLSAIDGETIQVLYASPLHSLGTRNLNIIPEHNAIAITENILSPESLGPWDDYVIRYSGNFDPAIHTHSWDGVVEAAFGVDWRNGLARPWADGGVTYNTFAESGLSGTATWTGELMGFTPERKAVRGDAALRVDIEDLTGSAAFTILEHWGDYAPPGDPGTGIVWGDGDLHYGIEIGDNYIRSNGGDAGYVSGRFVGEEHEGAVGILEHPYLAAGWGAMRNGNIRP